jgi:hypothetical protein
MLRRGVPALIAPDNARALEAAGDSGDQLDPDTPHFSVASQVAIRGH